MDSEKACSCSNGIRQQTVGGVVAAVSCLQVGLFSSSSMVSIVSRLKVHSVFHVFLQDRMFVAHEWDFLLNKLNLFEYILVGR